MRGGIIYTMSTPVTGVPSSGKSLIRLGSLKQKFLHGVVSHGTVCSFHCPNGQILSGAKSCRQALYQNIVVTESWEGEKRSTSSSYTLLEKSLYVISKTLQS